MSTFACPVVKIASVENHSGADRLSIVKLEGLGYTCISGKLEDGSPRYKAGDWVVYIPTSSVLPEWLLKEMDFWNADTNKGTLAGRNGDRVKPLNLRGVFSEGVLLPVEWAPGAAGFGGEYVVYEWSTGVGEYLTVSLGDDVAEFLGITKWSPPIPVHMAGEVASLSESAFIYDFERWESVTDIFETGESVVANEKLHGSCLIIQYFPDLDHSEMFPDSAGYRSITISSKGLGSQGLVFKNNQANANNLYVQAFRTLMDEYDLSGLMHAMSKSNGGSQPVAILGEVFGKNVQDLDYGTTKPTVRVFDMHIGRVWLTPDEFNFWGATLPLVPTLYRGPFDLSAIQAVRDGVTTVGGNHVREGVVVRSTDSNDHPLHGRKIAKFISPAYMTRKVKNGEATEFN